MLPDFTPELTLGSRRNDCSSAPEYAADCDERPARGSAGASRKVVGLFLEWIGTTALTDAISDSYFC